jgi:hypothetical protein
MPDALAVSAYPEDALDLVMMNRAHLGSADMGIKAPTGL